MPAIKSPDQAPFPPVQNSCILRVMKVGTQRSLRDFRRSSLVDDAVKNSCEHFSKPPGGGKSTPANRRLRRYTNLPGFRTAEQPALFREPQQIVVAANQLHRPRRSKAPVERVHKIESRMSRDQLKRCGGCFFRSVRSRLGRYAKPAVVHSNHRMLFWRL